MRAVLVLTVALAGLGTPAFAGPGGAGGGAGGGAHAPTPEELPESALWNSMDRYSPEALSGYLAAYPNGRYAPLARLRLDQYRPSRLAQPKENPGNAPVAGTEAPPATKTPAPPHPSQ